MAGGDNFERVRLSLQNARFQPRQFKDYVDKFLRGYDKYRRCLSDESSIEKPVPKAFYDQYKKFCDLHHMDKILALLYSIINSNKKFFRDDEVCYFFSHLSSNRAVVDSNTTIDTWSDIVQNLFSIIEKKSSIRLFVNLVRHLTNDLLQLLQNSLASAGLPADLCECLNAAMEISDCFEVLYSYAWNKGIYD